MDIIDNYFNELEIIYNYFGFKQDWATYPFEDYRKYYWKIINDSTIIFGSKNAVINETGNHYENEIYKQRFYNKWIYRGEKYTMIFVDTRTDGNKFFGIYNNSKEIMAL